MALDNIVSASMNKKSNEAAQKQKLKNEDIKTELKALKTLEKIVIKYCSIYDSKTLKNYNIKMQLIKQAIKQENYLKGIKYTTEESIELFLLKKYNSIIQKYIKAKKEADKSPKNKIIIQQAQPKSLYFIMIISKILKILLIILAIPFIILLGFISAICKDIK